MIVKVTNNNNTTWEIEIESIRELIEEMANPYNAPFNKIEFDNGYETTYRFNIYDEDDDSWFDQAEYEQDFYNEISCNTDLI